MKVVLNQGTSQIIFDHDDVDQLLETFEYACDDIELVINIKSAPRATQAVGQAPGVSNQQPDYTPEEAKPSSEPSSKRKKDKDLNLLRKFITQKYPISKIAETFGVSESTIYNWKNELKELDALYDDAGVSKV